MIRVTFFAAIFILMTNHAQSDGWEEAVTKESLAVGSAILEFVDEALLDGRMTGGVGTFIDGVYNYAGSVKDKIEGTVTQKPTENIE